MALIIIQPVTVPFLFSQGEGTSMWIGVFRQLNPGFLTMFSFTINVWKNIKKVLAKTPPPPDVLPSAGNPEFKCLANTQAEEDAYEFVKYRTGVKFTSIFGSIVHIIKGALGAGILSGHTAFMKSGLMVGIIFTLINGAYIATTLGLLVESAQVLYRRTKVPLMSYPEISQAALAASHKPGIQKYAKAFRYIVDVVICVDLFGACACYQIIIAKSIKQLVEDTQTTSVEGIEGYPGLRVYLAAMIVPIILICLIRHLKYLAPFSFVANLVILASIVVTVYYALTINPSMNNMVPATSAYEFLEFMGMNVFGMSCIGVIIPIENNMRDPGKFKVVFVVGMFFVISSTFAISFFGYVAFQDKCESPITVNFPMTTIPKILKVMIVVMIYVTHALNFWPPFNIFFHYIKIRLKKNFIMWELIWRAICVTVIGLIAIAFPSINSLMGFIGCLCLSQMAFIWPPLINTLVIWRRPGFGTYNWKLYKNLILIIWGILILIFGSIINGIEMVATFTENL